MPAPGTNDVFRCSNVVVFPSSAAGSAGPSTFNGASIASSQRDSWINREQPRLRTLAGLKGKSALIARRVEM
jgi:hypothetical protein